MTNPDPTLLIMDLDETMIHATTNPLEVKHDHQFDDHYVYKRPHLDWFLQKAQAHFKLAVRSSAGDKVALLVRTQFLSTVKNEEPQELVR